MLVGFGAAHPREGTALPSLLVIIPALNEEQTVGAVVRGIVDHLEADVLVIDDGSSDRTGAVATAEGAMVLRHPFNLGVGAAIRTGFRFAVAEGYSIVVQVDADGQHEVSDAKRLVELVTNGEADMAIGSRFGSEYEVSRMRRASMKMLSRRVSRYLGTRSTTPPAASGRSRRRPCVASPTATRAPTCPTPWKRC